MAVTPPRRRRGTTLVPAEAGTLLGLLGLLGLLLASATGAHARVFSSTFREVRELRDPARKMVVLFYNGESDDANMHTKTFARVERKVDGYEFYSVDCSLATNEALVQEAGFEAGMYPYVFVKARSEAIEAYPLEFEVDTLVTYIKVKESVADHLAVERFETEDAFYDLLDANDDELPAVVRFVEKTCALCVKGNRAATLLRERSLFVEVDCGTSDDTDAFCERNGVEDVPTVIVFTGEEKIAYDGAVGPLSLERYFDSHPQWFKASANRIGPPRVQRATCDGDVETCGASTTPPVTEERASAARSTLGAADAANLERRVAAMEARIAQQEATIARLEAALGRAGNALRDATQ